MNARILYHMARADFLERARRTSFLATVAGSVYFGYLINAGDVNLTVQGQRGLLGSAWVGTLSALCAGLLIPLFGFYLVKDAIERDRRTGVGEILAATPLGKVAYTCGKAASNFLFLSVPVAILGAAGLLLQMVAGEDRHIHPGAFLGPLAWLALPPVAIVAAVAVLFESIRFLRGTLGNVLYFFLWAGLIGVALSSPTVDAIGWHLVHQSLHQKVKTIVPMPPGKSEDSSFNIGPHEEIHRTFVWDGIDWTPGVVAHRLAVASLAVGVALVAAPFFGRFDPAKEGRRPRKPANPARGETAGTETDGQDGGASPLRRRRLARRFAIPAGSPANPFLALVTAELRLMLQGRTVWWFLAAAGLIVAELVAPLSAVRSGVLLAAWLWPIALWSGMGAREKLAGTEALVFTGPRPAAFGGAAIWMAGLLVTAATGAGAGLRLLLAGDGHALVAWAAACLFVPALAFALGAIGGPNRLFEVAYLLLWYIGPLNHVRALDFIGTSEPAPTLGMSALWLGAAALLLAAGCAARTRHSRGR